MDIKELDFSHVPLWIQFWGLPLHCKSIAMGKEMGSQLGQLLDVSLYEFTENVETIKVKILFNINQPIRAGMFISNDRDGITWVDFRFENLPMFCFGCGLMGHNIEACRDQLLPFEGGTNPRGAWLRSRNYGRRIIERNEKTFSSNPLKSISGGQFSLIPKGLLSQMASMSLNKQGGNLVGQSSSKISPQQQSTHHYNPRQGTGQMISCSSSGYMVRTYNKIQEMKTTHKSIKRKHNITTQQAEQKELQNNDMEGLEFKANQ